METIRNGSKGEAVKVLQKALGIDADGIFGTETTVAVCNFQKSKGLDCDGIVGAKTWEALGIKETNSKCVDSCVLYKPLPVHVSSKPNRQIKYICIHYTAGASSAGGRAIGEYNVFCKREASADFAVDDTSIVQFNPDIQNKYCWSVGDKKNPYSTGGKLNGKCFNNNSISIEICSNLKKGTSASAANHSGWYFTEAALDNAKKLTKILMKKYNIPLERVVRHYDVTGKLCPGIIGWNDEDIYDSVSGKRTAKKNNSSEWIKFKESLK